MATQAAELLIVDILCDEDICRYGASVFSVGIFSYEA
jgi:hypothetical protein